MLVVKSTCPIIPYIGPLTAAELCDRCEEDKAAISRSLDYLEKNGYIICEGAEKKRYKAPLRLTEKGRAAASGIAARIDRIVDAASEGLTEQERAVMYRALTRISGNLERFLSGEAGQNCRNTEETAI